MSFSVFLSLSEGVRVVDEEGGRLAFVSPPTAFRPRLTLRQVTPGLRDALLLLRARGSTSEALASMVAGSDGVVGLGKLFHYLGRLDSLAVLARRLEVDGKGLASLHPVSPYLRYEESKVLPDQPFVLSKFCFCRNHGGLLILESPRGHGQVHLLGQQALSAFHQLREPRSAADLAVAVPGLDRESALGLMRLLVSAAMVVPTSNGSLLPEDEDPVLGQWAFHDMLFHTRSRLGRHADPYGGTYPFKDRFEPLAVLKPATGGPAIPLFVPDLAALEVSDVPFSKVLEKRASLRIHGEEPLTVDQLGEFLYRSARIKRQPPVPAVSFRPSPSAGALHPLEIYPIVDRCSGLVAGLYHYDPKEHALHQISGMNEGVRILLELGGITAKLAGLPQVLLVISARFQRVQNKYQSVAYSAILKDVGCLYQTMYLVATAMGLAPCGLGGGHSDLFAQVAGLDYFAETSVGDFVLGTIGPGAWDAVGGEEWDGAHPTPEGGSGK